MLRPLASGGMGQVFLAVDPELERQVALKLLHRDPNRGLRQEAKTLAALSHPNIVTIFEIGEHEGQDFIAMEYLSGKTLRDILTGDRPSREELLAIVSSVAVALAAAHKGGILHRDIKPENVVTTPNGVKVVDFGIARRLEERASNVSSATDLYEVLLTPGLFTRPLTTAGSLPTSRDGVAGAGTQTVFGTPAYMAPEVLGGDPSSAASDVYSLGVVLYECLAGERPYDAGNLIETIAHIITSPAPTLDDPLNPLLIRMLAREPEDRPTLIEIIAALRPDADATTRPRSKKLWIAGVVLGAAAAAGGTALVMRGGGDTPSEVPEVPLSKVSVGIGPVIVEIPTWGVNRADGDVVARTLVSELSAAKQVDLTATVVTGGSIAAQLQSARASSLEYLVAMRIDEDKDKPTIVGTLAIFDVATGKQVGETKQLTAPSTQVRRLQFELLDAMLAALAPGSSLPHVHDRAKAQTALSDGNSAVQTGNFDNARLLYEAAVTFDPDLAEAWYGFALSLAWTEASEDLVLQAADRAEGIAPAGRRRDLMHAAGLFYREHFTEAREALEKLEVADDRGPDQVELLYFLGDANWHEGRHDAAYKYFMRAYAIPPRSRAMAIHPAMYLVARRLGDEARYIAGAAGLVDTNQIEFSLRSYEKLAVGTDAGYRVRSKLVLKRPVTDAELEEAHGRVPLDLVALHTAIAIERGDRAKAKQLIERAWAENITGKQLNSADYFFLEYFGEVVISAGLVDDARRLVTFLAETSKQRPRRGYHRFAMLTAALAKDASLIPHGPTVSERNRMLAKAAEAEIAGDHAQAATLLADLVHNPTFTWDYPERAALIRNLEASNRKPELDALCEDTLEPAIFRQAFLVVRSLCGR